MRDTIYIPAISNPISPGVNVRVDVTDFITPMLPGATSFPPAIYTVN